MLFAQYNFTSRELDELNILLYHLQMVIFDFFLSDLYHSPFVV